MLEVELKGVCEPYDVSIEPRVLLIPGEILQDTVTRRKFKVVTYSLTHILHIDYVVVCFTYSRTVRRTSVTFRGLLSVT